MLPKPDVLNEYPHGKFVLSNLAAKRAKQLKEGAPPLVQVDSIHPLTIALAEIAAGKIKPILSQRGDAIEAPEIPTLMVDDTLPPELGMLLPALDESEAALITTVEGESEDEAHEGEDLISLSDLVDEEEDAEEDAASSSDDDTLSLTDIAEAETVDEEGEDEE
ncbi:DNA-directed RNA polymerase subunit omega [bacterium]|nr:MAG: DNA-directed RNA polymerase subunit omega [bacterium]